jgi:tetratricopeptide (TPR) repeat protein
MNLKQIITLLFCFYYYFGFTQDSNSKQNILIDSLYRELKSSKYDTTSIRIKYCIGNALTTSRLSFWDSLFIAAEKYNLPLYEGRCMFFKAYLMGLAGENAKAFESYNNSIQIFEKSGNRRELFRVFRSISGFYRTRNDMIKALDYCSKAIKIAEEFKSKKDIASGSSTLGDIYFQTGDFQKAINLHLRSLTIFEELDSHFDISWTLLAIGDDYGELKRNDKKEEYYLRTLKYVNEFGSDKITTNIYLSVGYAYHLRSKVDSANFYTYKAYKIAKDNNDKYTLVSATVVLAEIAFKNGNNEQARMFGEEALALTKKINFTFQIPVLTNLLKEIYIKDKNYKEALSIYEFQIKTRDSVSNEKTRKQFLEKEFAYNIEKKESENKLLAEQNQNQALRLSRNNYIIVALMGILAVVSVFVYFLKKQSRIKQQQLRVEFTQKLLRSQINPHFMSNCLSAVQNLIYTGSTERAGEYLAKFSTFLRQILDTSEKHYLSLADEINTIRLYLELEQLRFKMGFNYKLEIAADLAQKEILVPSFMTQPFIENAIWHGLLPLKERTPQLFINIFERNKLIYFVIEDNGVGRKESDGRIGKVSKGTQLITESMTNLNLLVKSTRNKIEIVDLFNESGEPSGTRIIIQLTRYTLDE